MALERERWGKKHQTVSQSVKEFYFGPSKTSVIWINIQKYSAE